MIEPMDDAGIKATERATAFDVAGEMINQVKDTDPGDTETALFAGWDGLRLTLVLDFLLEQRIAPIDRLPFQGFAWQPGACRQKLDIAMCWLEAAPSLPNVANSAGEPEFLTAALVPQTLAEEALSPALANLTSFEPSEKLGLVGAEIVRTGIRTIWSRVHELLTAADERTTDVDDGQACRIAALMALELARPETIDARRDLSRRVVAAKVPHRHSRESLRADTALLDQLHAAYARSVGSGDGWASLKKVVAALQRADPEWMSERWGYDTDLGLINATTEFDIRKVDCNGRTVPEIRTQRTSRWP